MTSPKVLISCPVSSHKSYIMYDWMREIRNKLTYPNFDMVLVDNSDQLITVQRIQAEGISCFHVDKGAQDIREVMATCNEISRRYALEGGYDYLFSLECDIFPPVDVIERLLAHRRPVVAGMYFIGHFQSNIPMVQVYKTFGPFAWQRLWSFTEGFSKCTGGLQQVGNPGMGCMLIHRSILEHFKFRVDLAQNAHADSFFASDLFTAGVPVFIDTSIQCRHYNQQWKQVYEHESKRSAKG